MYKVAILGCENSHANSFLKTVLEQKVCDDIEFVGVYSDDMEAAKKLQDQFGVPVSQSYDEFVGKVDAIVITARHGDNHYKYAKPYIASGIPMFIDKPITVSEEDAVAFMKELKVNSNPFCGGSMCVFADEVLEIKKIVDEQTEGKTLGGLLRAPVDMNNPYGGFFFYSQHIAQVMTHVFGCFPTSVQAFPNGKVISVVVRYPDFDLVLECIEGNYMYHVGVSAEKGYFGKNYTPFECFPGEFAEFYSMLKGELPAKDFREFIAPVFVLNAIDRSLKSGKEEAVHAIPEI